MLKLKILSMDFEINSLFSESILFNSNKLSDINVFGIFIPNLFPLCKTNSLLIKFGDI